MVILYDQFNLSENVFELIFATEQQVDAATLLIVEFKKHGGVLNKTQMSEFANNLHEGITFERAASDFRPAKNVNLSYNKRQFYDRILTPMKGMGMIDYDLYKKVYKLSTSFTKTTQKIASMWANQVS